MIDKNEVFDLLRNYDKENSNLQPSSLTSEKEILSRIQKRIYLEELPKDVRDAHVNGDLHFHDLDFALTRPNCLQHPVEIIFKHGLNALSCISKPAKYASVAVNHVLKALALSQAHMAGGQSVPLFNVLLAPFFSGLKYDEILQIMQHFVFELNQLQASRGLQTIFSSVNCEYSIPKFLENETVEYSQNKGCCFGDFEDEARMILSALCDVISAGDGSGRPFTFPNFVTVVREDRLDDPLYVKFVEQSIQSGNGYWLNMRKYGKKLATVMGCASFDTPTLIKLGNEIFAIQLNALHHYAGLQTKFRSYYMTVDRLMIYVYDGDKFTKLIRIMVRDGTLHNFRGIYVTKDHPFITNNGDVKLAVRELEHGEKIDIKELDIRVQPGKITLPEEVIKVIGCVVRGEIDKICEMSEYIKEIVVNGRSIGIDLDDPVKTAIVNTILTDIARGYMFRLSIAEKLHPSTIKALIDELEGTRFMTNTLKLVYFMMTGEKLPMTLLDTKVVDLTTESEKWLTGYYVSHNCRTYLDDTKGDWHLFSVGTGNLEYATINLPRIAMRMITENVDFDEIFYDLVMKAAYGLMLRRSYVWRNWLNGMYPFFISNTDENYGYYYNIARSTMGIGFVGLWEFMTILDDFSPEKYLKMMFNIVSEMNNIHYEDLAERFDIDYKAGEEEVERWSLIASPAESAATRLKQCDMSIPKYHDILDENGLTDKIYYTNSFHYPEDKAATCVEKLMFEAPLHKYCNGGSITHLWVTELDSDPEALARFVTNVCNKTDIRYFTFSSVIAYCNECGKRWIGKENSCISCSSDNVSLYSKITGYLTEVNRWNPGKFQEFKNRNYINKLGDSE